MPFFKLKSKQPKSKPVEVTNGAAAPPVRPRWQSTWTSSVVEPEEVEELIHIVTAEMKLRAEALDSPFLLLPFRPNSDQSSARSFVNTFFKSNASGSQQYRGSSLQQELRLTSPTVLCSILKWCWSRMPKGVVSWPVYESFQLGEKESGLARNAFDTFIPLGSDSSARTNIIVDFYSLLAAVAAHGKLNGLGGRKLSRLAGWWAFEHTDGGKGFEGGYKSWAAAADASSHLFFAYLRSLSPDMDPSMNVIERIPRSLQALLASTEYPPEAPTLLQRTTPRVVMIVDQVSPTPFSLLRRAKHFEYRQNDRVLREYSEFEDPVDALTDECKRVLYAVSSINSAGGARSRHGLAKPDETWSSFTSIGFGELNSEPSLNSPRVNGNDAGLRTTSQSRVNDLDRPVTPSWGDFLSSGFHDEVNKAPNTMLLPPDKVLPPIGQRNQTPSIMSTGTDMEDDLTPGELAAITTVELDDAFWWVWMTSLAGEEPNSRKAVFGRCALIETSIMNGKWLIMEEQVKGASPDPLEGAQIIEKKSRFSFSKRGRLGRGKSSSKKQIPPPVPALPPQVPDTKANRMTIGLDQQAKIKAAAAALAQKKAAANQAATRRGRQEDPMSTKTNSTFTLGLQSEAGPAMKWANSYDKNEIRAAYLGNNLAGTGQDMSTENLGRQYTNSVYLDESERQTHPPTVQEPEPAHTASDAPLPPVKDADAREEPVQSYEPQHTAPLSPVEEAPAVERYDPLQKELGSPVDIQENHPAYRKEEAPAVEPSSPVKPSSPDANPAIIAAKMALEGRAVSPESTKDSQKTKKPSSGGGIKKFFSRKDKPNRRSMDVQQAQPSAGALSAATGATKNHDLPPQAERTSPKITRKSVERPSQVHEPVVAAEPIIPAHHAPYNDSTAALSRVDSQEQRDADIAFSRFDQGPMHDMPDALPKDSHELEREEEHIAAEPPSVQRYQPQTMPAHYVPKAPDSIEEEQTFAPAHERVASLDDQSEATMESQRDSAHVSAPAPDLSKDRWERIRENAARRAANARASEDTSTMSRPTEGGRTDDGETSGEESEYCSV